MSVEMVLLAPVFLLFLLLLVGAGRIVEAQGEVNGAARDAARAASVERDFGAAQSAASAAAAASLDGGCGGAPGVSTSGDWRPGGSVRVEVTCQVDLGSVAGFGFSAVKSMSSTAVAPLEQFRRVD
ncbi:membrane protein [Sphaerisporangium rufum]|uniref:Membrane protein n=2 Tax=Sphaerisporangium rufum TaxID=1381558 RepID=A0A919V2P9_9ACTN|nr:membrane protein [Sphaerisporangium rufum]